MSCQAKLLGALAFVWALVAVPAGAATPDADLSAVAASSDVQLALGAVLAAADNQGRPFAIVDKLGARLFVFGADGRLIGATAALLGLAPGDREQVVGKVDPARLAAAERITPAGRFDSEPGHNLRGEPIVWLDYDNALAIHRLRSGVVRERRAQRLASPSPADNRISLGCVVVPVAFYREVVETTLGRQRGVVYVLPETAPVQSLFDAALAAR